MVNEKRLIDAEKILKFCEDGLNNPDRTKAFGYDAIEIMAEIQYAPTIDAVEVVRCKDCKHWDVDSDTYGDAFGPVGTCSGICDGANTTKQDDFCSFGERRC